jgi:glucosylceramidase
MDGFESALTGSSADLIAQLAPPTRDALLRELFPAGNGGIGMSCLPISIGASDLSSATFSYDDLPRGRSIPALTDSTLGRATLRCFPC